MRKGRRLIVSLALALVLVLSFSMPVFAATTQDVTVTATPTYVSISNTPTTEALGMLAASSTTWAIGTAPADPLVDAGCTFTVTNNGNVAENIAITATDFGGGVGWTLASAVGVDTVVMKAGKSGDAHAAMVVVATTGGANFISSLAAAATKKWEFNLSTGTFTDGVEKSSTITLTATQA